MTTSNYIANQALNLIGSNAAPITGSAPNFDSSVNGKACAALYAGVVATVARQFAWDFARAEVALTATGNAAPFPWTYEYAYPAGCVQLWQIAPPSLSDVNNPTPVQWSIGVAVVGGAQAKVVWSNQAGALAIYNANPAESTWDAMFTEAVVRLLASELAMAVAGRPDTAQTMLESSGAFETLAERRES